jgi:isochorismate synthase EntC
MDRGEHETVVRAIREALAGVTEQLLATDQPQLRRLRNIQHLATEIVGRVRPEVDVLELVRRLHPTPAVCGWPREAARLVISAIEHFDRGWYAGPVGWLDGQGEGEFAVALRSALVRLDHAWLFAGNGIMGDSQPEAEFAEVNLKFRPLTEALGASAP